eukprot:15933-Heterococcus_DN1.PRE.2
MARYFSAAPTLELERCRLYTTWLGQPYPVPNNTKYLQYPTRDVQVRLQQLLEGVQSPITMLMCLPNAAACANSKSAYKSMWSPQCAMTKLRTTNAHATCYIGVQLGNRLLCKSQDPRRKSPKIVAAKACQYLNIQVDDTFMVGPVYIWSRIRPYLSHDDTAARLVAELTGYFNTRDQTAWAMDLLQLLKGTVKPLVTFPATDNECITSSVSGSTEPVLQRATVSVMAL